MDPTRDPTQSVGYLTTRDETQSTLFLQNPLKTVYYKW